MYGWAGDTQHRCRGVADTGPVVTSAMPPPPWQERHPRLRDPPGLQIPVAFVLLRPAAPEEPLAFSGLVVHLEMSVSGSPEPLPPGRREPSCVRERDGWCPGLSTD